MKIKYLQEHHNHEDTFIIYNILYSDDIKT